MSPFTRREQAGLLALVALVAGVVVMLALRAPGPGPSRAGLREVSNAMPVAGPAVPASRAMQPEPPAPTEPAEVVVHVTGAVRKPGVYHLPVGARGEDALRAAGGPLPEANPDAVNLAARLADGTQLFFPTRQQEPEETTGETRALPEGSRGSRIGGARATAVASGRNADREGQGNRRGKLRAPGEGYVNINTADAAQLQRLPHVGPAMAERILSFRAEMGPFQAPEDLLQVRGIGPKKFEQMRPFVRVR
ncbi:MAG: ComEA family DNA-binding protein [Chloroherpetonaceae bacterium]|nr:ComEA family DNA-binding protein [Chthonomonadaceae bacterium]MDW8206840.1 ComEA family DNA-binding protein [Chloroherpetonaceae bacterium]